MTHHPFRQRPALLPGVSSVEWVTPPTTACIVGWFGVLMIPTPAGCHHLLHRGLRGRAPCRHRTGIREPAPAP